MLTCSTRYTILDSEMFIVVPDMDVFSSVGLLYISLHNSQETRIRTVYRVMAPGIFICWAVARGSGDGSPRVGSRAEWGPGANTRLGVWGRILRFLHN